MSWESFVGLPLMARLSIIGGVVAFLLLLLLDHDAANNLIGIIKVLPLVVIVNHYTRKAKQEELPAPLTPLGKQSN